MHSFKIIAPWYLGKSRKGLGHKLRTPPHPVSATQKYGIDTVPTPTVA